MRIGVITNLKAGRGAGDAQTVLERAEADPDIKSFVTDRASHVRGALGEFAAKEVDVLVVNGGDGTLQRALTELLHDGAFERTPVIAPLRSGRTNSSARDLGARGKPAVALDRIIDLNRNGGLESHLVRRDVLKVTLEDSAGDSEVHFGMFCGLGVIDRAIRATHERFPEGRAQGALGGAVTTAGLLMRLVLGRRNEVLQPDAMRIELDGREIAASSYHLTIASTLERAFLMLKPFWGAGDGPVRITTIAEGAKHSARGFSRIVRGLPPSPSGDVEGYVSENVDLASINADCGLTIDGELFDASPGRRIAIEARENVSFLRS